MEMRGSESDHPRDMSRLDVSRHGFRDGFDSPPSHWAKLRGWFCFYFTRGPPSD